MMSSTTSIVVSVATGIAVILALFPQTAAAQCVSENSDGTCTSCSNPFFFGPYCDQRCTCKFGACDNGPAGSGTCTGACTRANMTGENCDRCIPNHYGPVCTYVCLTCLNGGTCDDGVRGTGGCICPPGYYGRDCRLTERSRTLSTTLEVESTPAPPETTSTTTTAGNTPRPTNASTTAPNITVFTTLPPVTAAARTIVALMLFFVNDVSVTAVLAAVRDMLGLTTDDGVIVTIAPQVDANYVKRLVFVATDSVSETDVQLRYARVLQLIDRDPRNSLTALSLRSASEVFEAPSTPAPPVTTPTPLPLPPPSEDDSFPLGAIVAIGIAVILFFVAIAVAIWYLYVRRMKKREKAKAAEEEDLEQRREMAATRMAGESLGMPPGYASGRRVKFGDGDDDEEGGAASGAGGQAALPTAAMAPEEEYAAVDGAEQSPEQRPQRGQWSPAGSDDGKHEDSGAPELRSTQEFDKRSGPASPASQQGQSATARDFSEGGVASPASAQAPPARAPMKLSIRRKSASQSGSGQQPQGPRGPVLPRPDEVGMAAPPPAAAEDDRDGGVAAEDVEMDFGDDAMPLGGSARITLSDDFGDG